MSFFIVSLDVQPEGIHTRSLKPIEALRCEAVTVGFNQDPEPGLSFDETGALRVEFGTTGNVPACQGDNVPRRAEPLLPWAAFIKASTVRFPCSNHFETWNQDGFLIE